MNFEVAIQNFIEHYGLFSIFIIVLLEYSNLPIPSEIILPIVGMLVSIGKVGMFEAIAVSIIAGILGSLLNYYLGYFFGNPLIKNISKKYPKLQKSINSSVWWMNNLGEPSVLVSRVIPLARTFISIPAGATKMNIYKFTLFSSLGIALWNSSLIMLGYSCSNNIDLITQILSRYSIIVFILIVTILIYFTLFKSRILKLKK